jgi:hypothetical protein
VEALRVIVQLARPVPFIDAARIVVPLKAPSAPGTILVLAVIMVGRPLVLRVSDNLAMARWRQANCDGGRAFWYHRGHHCGRGRAADERPVARGGVMSLRAAVNAMCKSCIYQPRSGLGGWREQVAACETRSCPLWPHRAKSRHRPQKATDSLAFQTDLGRTATGVAGGVDLGSSAHSGSAQECDP